MVCKSCFASNLTFIEWNGRHHPSWLFHVSFPQIFLEEILINGRWSALLNSVEWFYISQVWLYLQVIWSMEPYWAPCGTSLVSRITSANIKGLGRYFTISILLYAKANFSIKLCNFLKLQYYHNRCLGLFINIHKLCFLWQETN